MEQNKKKKHQKKSKIILRANISFPCIAIYTIRDPFLGRCCNTIDIDWKKIAEK